MILLKVKCFENTPDTGKTFSFMLGLDKTEKAAWVKGGDVAPAVEIELFRVYSFLFR